MHKTDFLKVTECIAGYIEIRAVGNVNFIVFYEPEQPAFSYMVALAMYATPA